ncbi:MAG: hypothetical protein Q9226_005588 [Calogaya cf. arnoldii]
MSAMKSHEPKAIVSQSDMQSNNSFPLMQLPTELRLQIYSDVLGCEFTRKPQSTWVAGCSATPAERMALMLCSRKVEKEVREVLCRQLCFTVEISATAMFFSSWKFTDSRETATIDRFQNFQTLPSAGHIKHWQFDLQFRAPYDFAPKECHGIMRKFHDWRMVDVDRVFIREGVLEAVAQLSKFKALGSLKIKFPCLCRLPNVTTWGWWASSTENSSIPSEGVIKLIHDVLEPLKTLKFQSPVKFIAAKLFGYNHNSIRRYRCQTENKQCEEAACQAFVTRFDKLAKFVGSSSPRTRLSAQHHTWLDIKHRAEKLSCGFEITDSLYRLWARADFNQDTFKISNCKSNDIRRREFNECYKDVSTDLKAAIKKEQIAKAEYLKLGKKERIARSHTRGTDCECYPRRRCTKGD